VHDTFERLRLSVSWIFGGLFIAFICFTRNLYAETPFFESIEILGYGLIIIAVIGRIWCSVYIAGRKDEELTTDGPYSIWRNPLYIFSFIGAMGIVLSSTRAVMLIVLIPAYCGYYYYVIKSEEQRLAQLFGQPYLDYCSRVNGIFPNFNNYWSRKNIDVKPVVLFRSIANTTWLLWAILVMEFLEYAQTTQIDGHVLLPILVNLPF